MNQRRNNGGNQRPQQQQQEMSKSEKLLFVLKNLREREREISDVLPPDMPFDKFHATIDQALRTNPDIMACSPMSIVNACLEAAFDGLRLDGKEAALVAHKVKVAKNPDRWEQQAEYFPMVYGLIKQILMSGEVISMHVDVIHEHDEWDVQSGSDPKVIHRPFATGERGRIIMAYSIATMKSGVKSQEVMYMADLAAVKEAAKTKYVWDAWPGEMSKKSAARRHKKRLPSGREWRDAEALRMFPQMQQQAPALPDYSAPPPRPTRQPALEQDRGQVFNDFGNQGFDQETGELVEQGRQENRQQQHQQQRNDGAQPDPKNDGKRQPEQDQAKVELPADDIEWGVWRVETMADVAKAKDMAALHAVRDREGEVYHHAPKDIQADLDKAFTDRAADIAAGPDDGAAADDTGNDTADGDE